MRGRRDIGLAFVLLTTVLWLGTGLAQESRSVVPGKAPAMVWVGAKVVDTQGWQYTGVRLRWVQDGAVLELRRTDGAIKLFAPEQIGRVYGADGADITHEVGAARKGELMSTSPPLELSQPDAPGTDLLPAPVNPGASASGPDSRRLFNTAIDAGVGLASASGNWYAGLDAGLNAAGGLRFMTSQRNYIHVAFRYQTFATQSFEIFDLSVQTVDVESAVNEFQVLVGRHAHLVSDKVVRSVGYAEFGIAALNHRFSFSTGDDESLTRLGFVAQGGLMVLMSEAAAWDLSVNAAWKPGWSGDEGTGFILGGQVGLVFFF